jgi:glycosyltransferase involved in cell wall biosynthesis
MAKKINSILFLSTVLDQSTFDQFNIAGYHLNPSHNHYYLQLMHSLSPSFTVFNFIFTPTINSIHRRIIPSSTQQSNNIHHLYLKHHRFYIFHIIQYFINGYRLIKRLIKDHTYITVYMDTNTLSNNLIYRVFKNHHGIHWIGVVTDNPYLLSNPSHSRSKKLIKAHQTYDAYLCLTPALDKLFNPYHQPNIIIPGICEPKKSFGRHPRKYIFFAGALYNRYGVRDLVEAFILLNNPHIDLIIAGYGPEVSYLELKHQTYPNIKFLGLLSQKQIDEYLVNAHILVNPRPINPDFDLYAVPSKLFDYFSSGTPVLSTYHAQLEKIFKNTCTWTEHSGSQAIYIHLKHMLEEDYALLEQRAQQAKAIAIQKFSTDSVGQLLIDWMSKLI